MCERERKREKEREKPKRGGRKMNKWVGGPKLEGLKVYPI